MGSGKGIKLHLNIKEILNRLSEIRPVFHSEADFQHAFAWEINKQYPTAKIRLEYPEIIFDRKAYIDIWLEIDQTNFAIELKYKTTYLQTMVKNESFNLRNHSAHDLGRLHYLRDIERLESISNDVIGYSIFLTNDEGYWEQPKRTNTNDAAFRIHESATLHGKLIWLNKAAGEDEIYEGNTINLQGTYNMVWENYSFLGEGNSARFRYLLHEIV